MTHYDTASEQRASDFPQDCENGGMFIRLRSVNQPVYYTISYDMRGAGKISLSFMEHMLLSSIHGYIQSASVACTALMQI